MLFHRFFPDCPAYCYKDVPRRRSGLSTSAKRAEIAELVLKEKELKRYEFDKVTNLDGLSFEIGVPGCFNFGIGVPNVVSWSHVKPISV